MAKHFGQEVTGNESVGDGHHLSANVIVSDNGNIDARFVLDNHVALTGFCAIASLWFFDSAENVVATLGPTNRWCVDGRHVPWGTSHRLEAAHWQISAADAVRIQKMALIGTDPGKNPMDSDFLKKAVSLPVVALG